MPDSPSACNEAISSDGPPMPEMRQGLLSANELDQLCADLLQLTKIQSIQTRMRGNSNAQTEVAGLDTVLQNLWNGNLQAVQVRYAYDGHDWTDTLLRSDCHVRVIRCQHPVQG